MKSPFIGSLPECNSVLSESDFPVQVRKDREVALGRSLGSWSLAGSCGRTVLLTPLPERSCFISTAEVPALLFWNFLAVAPDVH